MIWEYITIKTGVDWIGKLFSILKSGRGKFVDELDNINDILFEDPLEFARYYVEPECQDRNPADQLEEDDLLNKKPIMEVVEMFFQKEKNHPGDNQMFVLSDAGMGKTSFLSMLKLMHLTRFLPSIKQCVLKKLDEKTIEQIGEIKDKRRTILLLDSLDEDPAAFGKVKERLYEILDASKPFFKVIVTCRTQFFPNLDEDRPDRLGKISVHGFKCPVKYLSFFSDEKVRQYLEKRFPKKFRLIRNKKAEEASNLIKKMGYLRFRPMLLAYIDELMTPRKTENEHPALEKKELDEYEIYDLLVKNWMLREETIDPTLFRKDLLPACIILATYMHAKHTRKVPEDKLDDLIEKISSVKPVKKIHIKGRSLLNRNSEGDYRFSHRTIQEFLVSKQLMEKPPVWHPHLPIPVTDFMLKMMSIRQEVPNFLEILDFSGVEFVEKELRNIKLPGVDFSGFDFSNADLAGGDFSGGNFSSCKLIGANFSKCNLENADFSKSQLSGCLFDGANLRNMNLMGADLWEADFWKADLREFSFSNEFEMEFFFVPPGKFTMGSPRREKNRDDGEVSHEVVLSQGYFIQTTPVTVGQWRKFAVQSGYRTQAEREDGAYGWTGTKFEKNKKFYWDNPGFVKADDHPVTCVSWNDAVEFVQWLNKEEKGNYALPTEAQWEYACRAGSQSAYCFGDDLERLGEYAWYSKNSGMRTHPVRGLKPNAYGLYDMHGNVWEWCGDWHGDYPNGPATDPEGPSSGSHRVVRGGAWHYHAVLCRSAFRNLYDPSNRINRVGFRLVLLPGRSVS